MVMSNPSWIESKYKFSFVFLIWLLFIPNSFYILTDLYHLELSKDSPRWFDLDPDLFLCMEWYATRYSFSNENGNCVQYFLKKKNILFFLYPVMWLIAFGIYIGRYLRFNSWDVLTNPFSLFYQVGEMFSQPGKIYYAWGMIFCFSIFTTLVYLSIKKLSFNFSEKQLYK
jgi:uncharacterized membrane protein